MSTSWRSHKKDPTSQEVDATDSDSSEKRDSFSFKEHLQTFQTQTQNNAGSWTQLKEVGNQRYGRQSHFEDQEKNPDSLTPSTSDKPKESLQKGWRKAQLSQAEVESRITERVERMEKKKQKRLKSIQKAQKEWTHFKSKSKSSAFPSSSESSSQFKDNQSQIHTSDISIKPSLSQSSSSFTDHTIAHNKDHNRTHTRFDLPVESGLPSKLEVSNEIHTDEHSNHHHGSNKGKKDEDTYTPEHGSIDS